MWPDEANGLTTAFAVFVLCFCSHVNTTKITAELKYTPGKSKFMSKVKKSSRATITAYVICALSYFFVGVCGYMAFGNKIEGSILDSLKDTDVWFKPVVRVGYGLVVMFSYPILGFPACNTIDAYIFKGERTTARRISEGLIWVAVTFVLAVAIPQLEMIFGVTGNFCGVLIVFVWPALYFIAMCNAEKKKPVEAKSSWFKFSSCEYITAWIILVVGVILCIFCTAIEVVKLLKK